MQFRSKAQRRKGKAAAAAKSQGVKGSDGKKSSAKAKGREVSFAKQESAVIPALVEKMEKYDRDLLKYSMKGGKSEAAAPVVATVATTDAAHDAAPVAARADVAPPASWSWRGFHAGL